MGKTWAVRIAVIAGALVLVIVAVVAVNQAGESGDAGAGNAESLATPGQFTKALAGAPPKLAKLYAKGDELISGGPDELQAQLASVRGYPAVVNVWASWCGPCRFEFPYFQQAVLEDGDRVAFVGVNSFDDDAAARTFLDEFPIPYPSVTDPDKDIWPEFEIRGLPATAFYDSQGERVYVRPGPYSSADQLLADIKRYAG
ncbi:MAG: TlpA family protein disulfide reductase [Solirubrobacterales bacterium]